MSTFDVETVREQLNSEIGVEYYLGQSLDDIRMNNAITGTTDAMIGEAVRCLLVGYDVAAQDLLTKSTEWLEIAIDAGEKPRRYFRGATESGRYANIALAAWLLRDTHDQENLSQAVRWQDLWYSEHGIDKVDLGMSLPLYVDAYEYRRIVELYSASYQVPTSLIGIKSEGAMAYILAVHELEKLYSVEEIEDSLDTFFMRQMPRLMDEGQYVDAARWAKIAFWNGHQHSSTAADSLRCCLKYLSKCEHE